MYSVRVGTETAAQEEKYLNGFPQISHFSKRIININSITAIIFDFDYTSQAGAKPQHMQEAVLTRGKQTYIISKVLPTASQDIFNGMLYSFQFTAAK